MHRNSTYSNSQDHLTNCAIYCAFRLSRSIEQAKARFQKRKDHPLMHRLSDSYYSLILAGDYIRRNQLATSEPFIYHWQSAIDLLGPDAFIITVPDGYHWNASNIWELELKTPSELEQISAGFTVDGKKLLVLMGVLYNLSNGVWWHGYTQKYIQNHQSYTLDALIRDNTISGPYRAVINGLLGSYKGWGQ